MFSKPNGLYVSRPPPKKGWKDDLATILQPQANGSQLLLMLLWTIDLRRLFQRSSRRQVVVRVIVVPLDGQGPIQRVYGSKRVITVVVVVIILICRRQWIDLMLLMLLLLLRSEWSCRRCSNRSRCSWTRRGGCQDGAHGNGPGLLAEKRRRQHRVEQIGRGSFHVDNDNQVDVVSVSLFVVAIVR